MGRGHGTRVLKELVTQRVNPLPPAVGVDHNDMLCVHLADRAQQPQVHPMKHLQIIDDRFIQQFIAHDHRLITVASCDSPPQGRGAILEIILVPEKTSPQMLSAFQSPAMQPGAA